MPEERRHIAILFSDIVGYTSLMGSDESKAFDMLSRNRSIHEKHIKQFNGTLIKDIGDAILASFNLASDAVRCAIEIQKSCKEDSIPLKIGIHEGEVVFKNSDVFGDGVNLASRLQSDAQQGCINISGSVYRDIKNKSDILTRFIGDRTFKNVDEPIKVYQVLCGEDDPISHTTETKPENRQRNKRYFWMAGVLIILITILFAWKYIPSKDVTHLEKSIAVLPLKYLSDDQGKQYLADGVMDAITGHLSKIDCLIVRPRTSVEQYRDTHKTIKVIGEELGVSYLVEGSFLMVDNQVRLTMRLINAKDEQQLDSYEYDRDYSDIMSVQSEVAQIIANEIEVAITPEIQKVIEDAPTVDLTAYDYYLRAQDYATRSNNQDDINHALKLFEKAVEIDSNFTLAWVGLARMSSRLIFYGAPYDSTTSMVEYFLNKAKSIDANSVEVRRQEGMYYFSLKQEFDKAYKILKDVDLQHPNDDETVSMLGKIVRMKGELSNSIEYLKRSITLNPTNHEHWNALGVTYTMHKDYTKAEECFLKALELNPTNHGTYDMLLALYTVTCDFKKANNFITNYREHFNKPEVQNAKFFISQIYLLQGDFEKSIEVINTIPDKFEDISIPFLKYYYLGSIYHRISNHQNANHYFSIAKKYYEEYLQVKNSISMWDIFYAEVLAGLGRYDSAFEFINEPLNKSNYEENFTFGYYTEMSYISILVLSRKYDQAIKRLSNVIEKDGRISVEQLKFDPFWNPLREMDRFKEIINNPEYQPKMLD